MRKTILLFCAGVLFTGTRSYAQPTVQWQRALGDANSESAYASCQAPDGGYVSVGEKYIADFLVDAWATKFSADGDVEWQRLLGGSWSELLLDVEPTADGGFLTVGYSMSSDGDATGQHGFTDGWVVKLDANGNVLWHRMLGSAHDEHFVRVFPLEDNGCMLVGTNNGNGGNVSGAHSDDSDIWVVRLNAAGTIQWQRSFGGSWGEIARGAARTQDGGLLIVGSASSHDGDVVVVTPNSSAWVLKLDADGNLQWDQVLGGDNSVELRDGCQLADGSFMATGSYTDLSGTDVYAVKLGATGDVLWETTMGGSGAELSMAIVPAGNGCVIGASSASNDGDVSGNHGDADMWLVGIHDANGPDWQMTIGGIDSDQSFGLQQLTDGGFILSGVLFDPSPAYRNQFFVARLGAAPQGIAAFEPDGLSLGPNPAHDHVRVELPATDGGTLLTLTDVTGREVRREQLNGTTATIDVSGEARGLYVLRLRSKEGLRSRNLVLQ